MATIRYAHDSRTSAQNEARQWQHKVDCLENELAMFSEIVAAGRTLFSCDVKRQKVATKRLEKLLSENPNEA